MSRVRIHRAEHNSSDLVIVDSSFAQDDRLSFEARGVLGYILSKPDDWQITAQDIMLQGAIGKNKAYRLINELIACGYIAYDTNEDARNE